MRVFFSVDNYRKLCVLFYVVVCCLISSYAMAESTFSWLPNSESNIAGYKIYYGQSDGGPYPNVIDVGKPDIVNGRIYGEVSGLECGPIYYLVSTAYTSQGDESDPSNQAVFSIPDVKPQAPTELIVVP